MEKSCVTYVTSTLILASRCQQTYGADHTFHFFEIVSLNMKFIKCDMPRYLSVLEKRVTRFILRKCVLISSAKLHVLCVCTCKILYGAFSRCSRRAPGSSRTAST